MLEHCKRTQAVKVSLCVRLIFLANCGERELHCCYTVTIHTQKKNVFSSFGSIPDVLFGSVIREVSGTCSADTEYVISMKVIQECICCL